MQTNMLNHSRITNDGSVVNILLKYYDVDAFKVKEEDKDVENTSIRDFDESLKKSDKMISELRGENVILNRGPNGCPFI